MLSEENNMSDEQKCRVCGCGDFAPCMTVAGPCFWVEPDLCSGCVSGVRLDRLLTAIEDMILEDSPSVRRQDHE